MSVYKERSQKVISTMEKIHKIVGDTATIENLNEAKSVLNALALQRELFPASDFPWPSEGENNHMYCIFRSGEEKFALYVDVLLKGESNTPHDHGDSWAIVAGIEGQEKHDLYTRIDNNTGPGNASLELSASVTIDAGEAVSMLQGGIHSVEAIGTGPVLMLHCYGKAYEDQLSRLEFDLGTGKSAYGTTATGAISDLPLHP